MSNESREETSHAHEITLSDDPFTKNFLKNYGINTTIWFFPGLIMHEAAHALAGILSGGRLTAATWWSKHGGFVSLTNVSWATGALVSLAPLLLAPTAILLFQQGFSSLNTTAKEGILLPVLFLWLAVSLAIFSIPSVPDLKNCIHRSRKARQFTTRTPTILFSPLIKTLVFYIPMIISEITAVGLLLTFRWSSTMRFAWMAVLCLATLNYFPT
ncbi:TPA: hypothetical protein HA318_04645 [Candidatus Micrarchaeota archaeon]|nr:MAG: hypothetical protein AUJ65_01900 [Candidatus Micrarchaeota archaeon CG1_02_51_15]HII39261.1 hypothetical protein [Candidatus Micrarchaeota archaeon]